MITVKQQSKLMERIKTLSELELDSFFEELSEHLRKNDMTNLIDRHFDNPSLQNQIDDLHEEYNDLERDKEAQGEKLDDIQEIVDKVVDIEEFEEDSFDELKKAIEKINQIL